MDIKVSYFNKGIYVDRDTGEQKPVLPKNDARLEVVDFKQVWMNQLNLPPGAPKGTSGMIFPWNIDEFKSMDHFKETGLCSNGLVFVDIDCGEVKDLIMNNMETINERLGGSILSSCLTRKGLHVIFISPPLTWNEYAGEVFLKLTSFAKVVMDVCEVDLRKIPGALDGCTFSIKQRLFLRHSPRIFWNDRVMVVKFSRTDIEELKSMYNELWDRVSRKIHPPRSTGIKTYVHAELIGINPVEGHPYIEHHVRWRLFDSLCCIFKGNDLWTQWWRCCGLIDPVNHPKEFFENEPIRNKWYDKWVESNHKSYDETLLEEFGYVVGREKVEKWIGEKTIDELLDI